MEEKQDYSLRDMDALVGIMTSILATYLYETSKDKED